MASYEELLAEFGGNDEEVSLESQAPVSSADWDSVITETAQNYPNIPEQLVRSLIQRESSGDPYAEIDTGTKWGKARGLGQFIDETAKRYIPDWKDPSDSYDPVKNIKGIYAYLDDLVKKTGSLEKALIKYHGGSTDILGTKSEDYAKQILSKVKDDTSFKPKSSSYEDLLAEFGGVTEQVTEQPTEQVVSRGESVQSGDSFLNKLGQSATSSLAGLESAIAAAPGLATDAILTLGNNINKAINFFTNKTFNKKFLAENMKAPEWTYDIAGKVKEKISTDNKTVNSLLDSFSSKHLKDIQQTTSQSSKMTEEGKGVVGSLWSKLKKGEIKDAAEYLTYATVENGIQNILAGVISAYTARPELGLAILAGTSASDKMREYVENGNQTDDRTMQVLNSINNGLMEYAGERVGTFEILKPLRNKFFKIASEEGVDQAKKIITKPIVETIKNIAKNTGKEVSSEVFTQLGQNLGDIIAGDKEMTLKEAFSGVADAGLLAITSSGPMTTLSSISETNQNIRQQELQAVQQELQAVDEQGNPVSTMTEPAQQLIDEQGEVDESPYIKSFDMTEEDLLSRYEYDKEGRNLLRSAVTTDPKIDEETRSRLLSEMDQIDNTTEEVIDEEETETLLNEQEPAVEPQSSQEATTPIPTTETAPNADLPSVETATEQPQPQEVIPASIEEEQVLQPVSSPLTSTRSTTNVEAKTTPSYIIKRDDGTVVVDKRNIQDEILASVFKTNKNNELSIEDVKNALVNEYSKTFNNKLDAIDQIKKIESIESLIKELDGEVEYINKEQFLEGLKSFGYSTKQIQVVTELINNLKVDKLPKITNEKLLGKKVKNNFYGFSKNILSAETPDALMHEVGHFAFYNVLDSNERIDYMKYMIDKFTGTDKNINNDLATKNIQLDENTKVYTNTNKDFDEYFAEQFRQYVIENKVTDSQFRTLFSRLKEYLDAVLKAFRKTGYNKDLVKYFDKIIDGEKTNIELSQDQKKFISRLDVPKDKLSVAKEIVGNIDFSVPYQNASEEAKLGPKFKRLIRIIANDPEFSIELNGEEVTLKDAIKGKTRQQMAEIADLAGLGTELEAQGAGSTMKKQERRQFVESITNGMEYTPELEQQIKKEFAGNKDFNFDKIFEVVTGDVSKKEQNRIYKEGVSKGFKGEKLTKYLTDEINKLPGRKILLIKNPKKFAALKGEDVQSVDAKDIDIIYDKDVIDDKIKANITEIKKKRKPPKRYTQQEKEALYVNDKIKLKLGGGNIKTRFYDFVNKHLYGAGANSYRRQIFELLEEIKDNNDPLVNKAIELIDEAIEFRKVSKEFTKLKAFTRRKSVKSNLKEENSDMIDINKRIAEIDKKYQQFVDYQTLKRLKDRGGEVIKPKVVADTVRRLRGSDKYVVVNKETNKITTSERFDTKEAAREWINKNSERVSSNIGEKYESVINQGFVEPISKTDKKRARKLGLPENTEFDFYQIIKTDDVKERISELKRKLTDSNGKMFDAERIRIEVTKIKEDYRALVSEKEVIKVTKNATLEEAVDNIGIQLKAKKRTDKQTKSALMWGYKENSKSNWLKPFGLVGVNFRYKMQEMDDYDNKGGMFQKYILKPMDENRQQVYENENYIDMGLKGDIQKYDLTFKEMMAMSDQITVGTVERFFSGDKMKRKRKVKFENGEIEMSEAREVTLYLISKNERGYKRLTTGGIFIETDEVKKNPFIFTDKDIIELEKRLNSRQKKLVKVIISHFNRQSEVGNKISMSDIGEKIFNEPNYFPFLVDTDYIDQNKTLVQTPDDIRKTFFKGLPSITKERQNSNAPIILEDPFVAVARTTQLFNKYMDMVLVTNKTWSIINDGTFRKNMIDNGFEAEYHAIRDDLMDIMTVKPFDSSEDLLKVISSIFTVSVLGYKPTVSLSQPIATVLYFPEMDVSFEEFVVASLNFKNWVEKASIKEIRNFKDHMEKLSPYLKKRFNSSMEIIKRGKQTRATAADMFFGGKQLFRGSNFGEKLGSLAKFALSSKGAMSWIQNMDMVGVMGIWKLLEVEAIAKGYKRGTPEFNEYVARRTEHVTLMTQQTFDSLDSPPLARSGLGRLTTRFLSQTLKNTMMLRKQLFLMNKHGIASKEGFKAGCNSLGIILSQSLAVELLKVGIKAVGGGFDDDEWMTWQYWAKSLGINVLTFFGMPGIVLSGIVGGYGNVGGGNFGALTERIGDSVRKLKSAISNQDGEAATIAVYELGKTFLPIGGPEQIYKFAKGLVEIWGL